MRREGAVWAVVSVCMPWRRVMPPVGESSQLSREVQERV